MTVRLFRAAAPAAAALLVSAAQASFVVNIPSSASFGPLGNPNNGVASATYTGSDSIFSQLSFSGDLTDGGAGSWRSEARWQVRNVGFGTGINLQPATGQTWAGTVPVAANFNFFMWANNGDQFQFESFESFDDPGLDATWSNVNFTFDGALPIINLGTYPSGTAFEIDTETSSFDTELALFTKAGQLLFQDDDGGTGLLSYINAGVLPDDDYIILAGGFNSQWVNGFALAGTSNGDLNVQVNGANVFSGVLASGELKAFSFAVPEPASITLLALGALAAFRRR